MTEKKDSSQRLQEVMKRAMEASKERSAREAAEAQTRYTIEIPSQKLVIYDRQLADITIRRLKDVGVRGSYRATKA